MDSLDVKISVTTINDHLRPENTVITKALFRKLNNNSLILVLIRGWMQFDYLNQNIFTSFIDISVYRQSFASLLVYYQLLLHDMT